MQAGRLGWSRGIRGDSGRIGGYCRNTGGGGRRRRASGSRYSSTLSGDISGDSAGAGLGLCLPCLGSDAGRETVPGLVPVLRGLLLPVLRSCRAALPAWVQLPPALGLRLCCVCSPAVLLLCLLCCCCCRSSSICLGAALGLCGSSARLVLCRANSGCPRIICRLAKLKPAGALSSAGCIRYLGRALLLISGDGKQV